MIIFSTLSASYIRNKSSCIYEEIISLEFVGVCSYDFFCILLSGNFAVLMFIVDDFIHAFTLSGEYLDVTIATDV